MKSLKSVSAVMCAVVAASGLGRAGKADTPLVSFTPGDLVVVRGGDATHSQDTAQDTNYSFGEVPAYLDEYTTDGVYVGTLAIPFSGAGQFTLPGKNADSHEGGLNLSPNGQWLAIAGYGQAPSTTESGGTSGATRVAGVVSTLATTLNTSTIVNAYPSNVFRAALTLDGGEFYTAGKYPNGGLTYVSGTGSTATTTILQPSYDWRNVNIFNGTLYGGTGSSSVGTHGAYEIGTPNGSSGTYGATLLTNNPGGNSASNLAFVTIPNNSSAQSQNGLNVLYTIGDQGTPNLAKFYFDGTTWQQAGGKATIGALTPTGLIATIDSTNPSWVDIFVSGSTGIYSYIDKSADPTAALPSGIMSDPFVMPSSDTAFYGLAYAPGPLGVYWTGGTGNWSNVVKWSINPSFPVNNSPAGAQYAATISTGIVHLDMDIAVSSLALGHSGSSYTGTLDLGSKKFIVESTGSADKTTKIAGLTAAISAGSNGGTWNGNGITSSAAAGNSGNFAVGLFDNAVLNLTSFGGQPVDANSILLGVAHIGDANGSGIVDIQDQSLVTNNWQQPRNNWAAGDLNRDGFVDIQDLTLVTNNWQKSAAPAAAGLEPAAQSVAAVPEPNCLLLLSVGATALLSKRRAVRSLITTRATGISCK